MSASADLALVEVEVRGLTKSFGAQTVLHGIDLRVMRSEWVALMGPSGCGKSTLLHLLGGLDGADGGSICVAGSDVTAMSRSRKAKLRRHRVGYVFQSFNLVAHLDVQANIALPARLAGASTRDARRRADELLDELDMLALRHASPSTLSGGQQQRVAVARAIANQPRVLLADEPTGSLDSESARGVLQLLKAEHGRGQTIVMVTHDHQVAAAADRVVRMRDGRVVGDQLLARQDDLDGGEIVDDLIGSTRIPVFDRLVSFEP